MVKLPFSSNDKNDEAEKAIKFIKENKKKLISNFASDEICPPSKNPASFFMAGAPGAGKTEIAKMLIYVWKSPAIRIDPDEIKKQLPGYNGSNSEIFHRASSLGIEKIHDYALAKRKSIILDATFAEYEISHKNITRSIKKGRTVVIFYVHQSPELSWDFTLKREKLEGRHVPKKVFEYALKNSGLNVVKIKREFGKEIKICLVEKNIDAKIKKFRVNIGADELESFLAK